MSDAFYNALCDHQQIEGYEEGYKDGYEAGKRDAASPWHMVKDDELPSEFQDVWAACKMNGRKNWTIETMYDPYLSCPWGHIPVLDSGRAIVYAWMDRTAPEPPKEEE